MNRVDYTIHADRTVTLDGEVVGNLVTGEEGAAYVDFLDGFAPSPGEAWFHLDRPPIQ